MQPIRTEDTNVTLTHPQGDPLPAERVEFINPRAPAHKDPGFETTWTLDDGERRAVLNGAPVLLRVWGMQHPPVSLGVGEPPADAQGAYGHAHVMRAAGFLYGALIARANDGEPADDGGLVLAESDAPNYHADFATTLILADDFMGLWRDALQVTRDEPEAPDGDE